MQAAVLLVVVLVASFLDAVGIALILPILETLLQGSTSNRLSQLVGPLVEALPLQHAVLAIVVVFFGVILVKNVFLVAKAGLEARLSVGLQRHWNVKIFEAYTFSDYNFVLNSKQGVLANNILVETEKAVHCVKFLVQLVSAAVITTLMLAILVITSWQVTGLLGVVGLLFLASVHRFVFRYSRTVGQKRMEYNKQVGEQVSEVIAAMRQIKTFSLQSDFTARFASVVQKRASLIARFRVLSASPRAAGEVLVFALITIAMAYVLLVQRSDPLQLIPVVGLFLVVGQRMITQMSMLLNSNMQILSSIDSLFLVDSLSRGSIKVEDLETGDEFEHVKTDIVFDGVTFGYGDSPRVLDNVTLTIPRGEFVAIVGVSGAGKSTLVDLLLGLQRPDAGHILLDGQPLKSFNLVSWRRRVGFVSQDVFLFNGTVRDNLVVGKPDASEEAIRAAARQVNADEFIEALPDGYDTVVGDRGFKLSGGQRQRVALARSLLRDPDLLIFDEATSALDQSLEREILEAVRRAGVGRTIIFITHRRSATVHADVVYRLENGRIVKEGWVEGAVPETAGVREETE